MAKNRAVIANASHDHKITVKKTMNTIKQDE